MSKATTKEVRALLETAGEMFEKQVACLALMERKWRAETIVPDAKEYISESIDNPEVLCDSETWDRPGFTLVFRVGAKWLQKCHKLAPRGNKNPERYLTKEQQKHASTRLRLSWYEKSRTTAIELMRPLAN